jgi:hypothetical protein
MSAYSWQRPTQRYERDVITDFPRGPRPSAAVGNDGSEGKKRSVRRRPMRAVFRFFIAVLIGVGATLAWQSYGDEANEMVRAWAPSLAWLLPNSTKSPRDDQVSTAAFVTSAEVAQQLKPVALDLSNVRRGIDQLAVRIEQIAATQEKMARDIAILPAVEQDIREKLSPPPQPRTVAPRRTPQSTGQQDSPPQSAR